MGDVMTFHRSLLLRRGDAGLRLVTKAEPGDTAQVPITSLVDVCSLGWHLKEPVYDTSNPDKPKITSFLCEYVGVEEVVTSG